MAEVKLAEKNNPPGEKCGACKFYLGGPLGSERGFCRKDPRSLVFVGMFHKPPLASQSPIPDVRSFYPEQLESDWCGHFAVGAPVQPIDFSQITYGDGEHPLSNVQAEGEG